MSISFPVFLCCWWKRKSDFQKTAHHVKFRPCWIWPSPALLPNTRCEEERQRIAGNNQEELSRENNLHDTLIEVVKAVMQSNPAAVAADLEELLLFFEGYIIYVSQPNLLFFHSVLFLYRSILFFCCLSTAGMWYLWFHIHNNPQSFRSSEPQTPWSPSLKSPLPQAYLRTYLLSTFTLIFTTQKTSFLAFNPNPKPTNICHLRTPLWSHHYTLPLTIFRHLDTL